MAIHGYDAVLLGPRGTDFILYVSNSSLSSFRDAPNGAGYGAQLRT
jgi:hypothetical protein